MLETFTVETFTPLVGNTFQVADTAPPLALALSSITELGRGTTDSAAKVRRIPFSLLFHGPAEVVLPQRIYRLEHDGLGAFEIFLVPLGPDKQGMRYEAIFT